jgi:hypothetical protein
MADIGHNSVNERIKALAARYAKADEASMELNDERADIRAEIKDMGFDTKAWQDQISRAKQSLKKKEGYDESARAIQAALGEMDMDDLFEHVLRREREKVEEREERKAQKERDEEYKPAPERKPKAGKSIGEQQADAILAAETVN